ncbi:hypothetical protein [Microbacterium terricola]|nr:hypothetical protein [Microbacterium terricola]UYK40687.1 hypothetical protein OAU46_03280 [Microbacterium terricola]
MRGLVLSTGETPHCAALDTGAIARATVVFNLDRSSHLTATDLRVTAGGSDMAGPERLAARLLRAMVADDVDAVSDLVVEIEDSGYAGLVATGLAQSYISELLKTTRREPLLRALEARVLELTDIAEHTDNNPD